MNRRLTIDEQVEKTMNSLDGAKRAKSNPFLYTRIQARLQNSDNSHWAAAARILGRPVFAIATVLLVILMNAAVFLQNSEPVQSNTKQEEEQLFAKEYNLSQGLEDGVLAVNNDELP